MKQAITMPALSDTMNNGRLVKWLKRIGDPVKRGEVIAEVETDKAVMEVEAFHDGYLAGPLVAADAEFPVGQTIGYVVDSATEAVGEAPPPPPAQAPTRPPAARAPVEPQQTRPPAPATPRDAGVVGRASPYARRLAQQLGVDLGAIGGASGAIRAADVLSAAGPTHIPDLDAGPPYRIERNSSFREAVAQTMIASLATPTFRVTAQLLVAPLMALAKERTWSLNVLFARAAALAIKEHPLFNAVYTPEGIAHRERVDVGIAVDTSEGLITPVLRDVAGRPFDVLSQDWRALVEKAGRRRLAPAEYRGATFYVSHLGIFPVVCSFDSIIPLGACALLSIAAAREGTALFTLNCDHRVVFGGDAARFLQTFENQLTSVDKLTQ
jgi:pyruvate dehydrogenase E2 component (dihydrolipoamide acetyltransferase)